MLAVTALVCAHSAAATRKILCLHGGGGSASSLQAQTNDLQNALGDVEFVFAQGPYGGSQNALWILDPPNGKGQPTTDPQFNAPSVQLLDRIVAEQGPFYGILGYSQGTAMAIHYLSTAPANTFEVAMLFCPYLPETHQGLMDTINQASPFGGVRSLIWMGEQDFVISNQQSRAAAAKFTDPTIVVSPNGAHFVPGSSDSTFSQVVSFARTTVTPAPTPTPSTMTPAPTPTPSTVTPAPTPTPSIETPAPTPTPSYPRKILCLHGGGGTGEIFENEGGMPALQSALGSNYEFVFPSAPGRLWFRDAPGGKNQGTTDPNWAADSKAVLDRIVQEQGPFYGILGFSQGTPMAIYYMSQVPANTFEVAMLFTPYLPTVHQGIMQEINQAIPFNGVRALIWTGGQDPIVSNAMAMEAAAAFVNPTVVNNPNAGHIVPGSSDPTWSQVVDFVGSANGSPNGPVTNNGNENGAAGDSDDSTAMTVGLAAAGVVLVVGAVAGTVFMRRKYSKAVHHNDESTTSATQGDDIEVTVTQVALANKV